MLSTQATKGIGKELNDNSYYNSNNNNDILICSAQIHDFSL